MGPTDTLKRRFGFIYLDLKRSVIIFLIWRHLPRLAGLGGRTPRGTGRDKEGQNGRRRIFFLSPPPSILFCSLDIPHLAARDCYSRCEVVQCVAAIRCFYTLLAQNTEGGCRNTNVLHFKVRHFMEPADQTKQNDFYSSF